MRRTPPFEPHQLIRIGKDKKPLGGAWTPFESVDEMDQHAKSGGCFGLLIDKVDLAIIDIDTDKQSGAISDSTIKKLLKLDLPSAPEVRTPSGGFHRFYRVNGTRPKRQIRPFGSAVGIDILGTGGYAALYPDESGDYSQYCFDEPPEFPTELATVTSKPSEEFGALAGNIAEGNRNETIFKMACDFSRAGVSPESIWQFIEFYATNKCSPSYPLDEARKTFESAMKNEPPTKSVQLQIPESTLESIKTLDLPERRTVIGPFQSAATHILAATRGTGKTMLATPLGQAVSSGEPFCNWRVEQPGKVMFLQLDMSIQAVQKRARGKTWHPDFHYVTRWHFQRAGLPIPNLSDPTQHAALIELLSGYRMVIFDTRRAVQPPGEGAAANIWHPSYWMASAPVRYALADAGVCVVFLDHLNENGSVKDTKSIEDDVDMVITLKESDQGEDELCVQMELSKDRDGVHMDATIFEYNDRDGWRERADESQALIEKVYKFRQQNTIAATAERFNLGTTTVKRWVKKYRAELRREAQDLAASQ